MYLKDVAILNLVVIVAVTGVALTNLMVIAVIILKNLIAVTNNYYLI